LSRFVQKQWRFLHWIPGKNYFGRIFQKFSSKSTLIILYQNLWNFSLLSAILFWERVALKKFTQVLSYVFFTKVRRSFHKQIIKRSYGEERPRHFISGKWVLITPVLGLTTRYSLGILAWNFYQTLFILSIDFWLRFEPQILSTRFAINFFIHHCQGWKEGLFVRETVWFFSWVNTHPFDLKFVAFCPKFSRDSYVEFQEKTISGELFRNFVQTKAIIYQNFGNFALVSTILFWVRIALTKLT